MHAHHGHIALRRDVRIVQRVSHTILFRAHGFRAVRVGGTANVLLPPLRQGTQWSEMHSILQERHPDDPDVALKLDGFLCRLEAANLLNSGEAESASPDRWHRWELLDLNPIAARLARVTVRIPAAALVLLTLAAAAGVIVALPGVVPLTFRGIVNPWGIAFLLLVVVPLHELAHAVACRAAGVPVSGAGLLLHGGLIPGPFVDTSMIYAVADRWTRFRVPIVGPLVGLWAAGAAAWLGLHPAAGPVDGPLASIMMLSLVTFFLDMNPFFPTDGSRALEALLDDELARSAALARHGATLSTRRAIRIYRVFCALYLCTVATLVVLLWT